MGAKFEIAQINFEYLYMHLVEKILKIKYFMTILGANVLGLFNSYYNDFLLGLHL